MEWCEDKIPSQGTGMMDVKARGGLFCSWLEARAPLSPWESSSELDALPKLTTGPQANHHSYLGPRPVGWVTALQFSAYEEFLQTPAMDKEKKDKQDAGLLIRTSAKCICFPQWGAT